MATPEQYLGRLSERGTGVPESEPITPDIGRQRENYEQGTVIAGDLEPQVRTIEGQTAVVQERAENARRGLEDSMASTQAGIDQMSRSTPEVDSVLAGYKTAMSAPNNSLLSDHPLRDQGTGSEGRFGMDSSSQPVSPPDASAVAVPSAPPPADVPVIVEAAPVVTASGPVPVTSAVEASIPANAGAGPNLSGQVSSQFVDDRTMWSKFGDWVTGKRGKAEEKLQSTLYSELPKDKPLGLTDTPATSSPAPVTSRYDGIPASKDSLTTLNIDNRKPHGQSTKRFDMHQMRQNMTQFKDTVLHKSSTGQKLEMAGGTGLAVDGVRRVKNALKKDPETGKRSYGKALVGVGEFTAGVIMARHGYNNAGKNGGGGRGA